MEKEKKRILVLEDEVILSGLYLDLFEDRMGFDVVLCNTLSSAMTNLELKYDLMLLDIKLPDGSGLNLLRCLRKKEINTPVIIHSGVISEEDRRNVDLSRELGAVCFIDKPASKTMLKNAALAAMGELSDDDIDNSDSFAYIQTASDGTHKFVTLKKQPLEFALIKDAPLRRTICLSSQFGCGEGCNFCVTGTILDNQVKNVTYKEMESKIAIARLFHGGFKGKKVRILFAGEGEPSRNLNNILKLIERQGDKYEYRISTVGLVKTMPRIIETLAPIPEFDQLQISLHAPNDDLRKKMMKSAHRNPISKILHLGEKFFEASGKEVALNYVLFNGINDSPDTIRELIKLLKERQAFFVRLSMANPFEYFQPVSHQTAKNIEMMLNDNGIKTKRFKSAGRGTSSPCGHMSAKIGGLPI